MRERRVEPSFVQPGTIATNDCADLNRSLIVHSLSRKTASRRIWPPYRMGLRVQKHTEPGQCSNGPHILRDVGHHAAREGYTAREYEEMGRAAGFETITISSSPLRTDRGAHELGRRGHGPGVAAFRDLRARLRLRQVGILRLRRDAAQGPDRNVVLRRAPSRRRGRIRTHSCRY